MELTLGAALGVGEICYSKYYWTIHRDTWPKFLKESGSRKGGALFLEVSGNELRAGAEREYYLNTQ